MMVVAAVAIMIGVIGAFAVVILYMSANNTNNNNKNDQVIVLIVMQYKMTVSSWHLTFRNTG